MTKIYKLATAKREEGVSANVLRSKGFIPLELYGKNESNIHLQVKATDFTKIFSFVGESS